MDQVLRKHDNIIVDKSWTNISTLPPAHLELQHTARPVKIPLRNLLEDDEQMIESEVAEMPMPRLRIPTGPSPSL